MEKLFYVLFILIEAPFMQVCLCVREARNQEVFFILFYFFINFFTGTIAEFCMASLFFLYLVHKFHSTFHNQPTQAHIKQKENLEKHVHVNNIISTPAVQTKTHGKLSFAF